MKVGNKYIKIKNGKQNITIKNTILDSYLRAVKGIQFTTTTQPQDIRFNYVFIKLNIPIDVTADMEIERSDFDVEFSGAIKDFQYILNNVSANYFYQINQEEMKQYVGDKITAIGFGYNNGDVGAVVDTRNYNLYVLDNSDLKIARCDVFSSDSLFHTDNNVEGMLHMFPIVEEKGNSTTYQWRVLKSVGAGVSINKMLEEYSLEDYENELSMTEFGFEVNRAIHISHENEGLFPSEDIYPSASIYPERVIREPIYPSRDIYPSDEIYPTETPYQYIQLKYQIYEYNENAMQHITALDKYYIVNTLINSKLYKIKEKVRYERATL